MKHAINRFDQKLIQWVASFFGPRTRPFFLMMTIVGDPLFTMAVAALLIVYGLYTGLPALTVCGVAIPVTIFVGTILKVLFERARPVTEYAMHMKLKTFSFPSGHSTGSTITYGLLAYLLVSLMIPYATLAAVILGLVPLFVGISRVYLGAHFPSDVVAGWLLGIVSLCVVIYVMGVVA